MNNSIFIFLIIILSFPIPSTAETQYKIQVNGLVCPFCEYNVQKKLSALDGVIKVEVNLKQGQVLVLMEDGKLLTEELARKQLIDAGFTMKQLTKLLSHQKK